jgi:hypothetical protein
MRAFRNNREVVVAIERGCGSSEWLHSARDDVDHATTTEGNLEGIVRKAIAEATIPIETKRKIEER